MLDGINLDFYGINLDISTYKHYLYIRGTIIFMDALTQSSQHHVIKREPRANNPVPLRWRYILDLHLAGYDKKMIAIKTGYSLNSVYRILNHPDIQYVRQQLLDSTQQEFQSLFSKVVDTIREDLHSDDPKVRAEARSQWLKAHGKVTDDKPNANVNLTAEDMVVQILNGGASNNNE